MTKVVCTLGPASDSAEVVNSMIQAGVAVVRLNFSHVQSYDEPLAKLKLVREAPGDTSALGWPGIPPNLRGVLVDTKGPEVRTGELPGGREVVELEQGQSVTLTHDDVSTDAADAPTLRLSVDYPQLSTTVQPGGLVLLDDGLLALRVLSIDANKAVHCEALNAGPIKARKGVNLPGAVLDLPALTDKDREDLRWAVSVDADFVAASFIRSAANVRSIVAHLERCCDDEAKLRQQRSAEKSAVAQDRPLRPLVISKIESEEGVQNFDEILDASDGIMVARGDLGVEIPFEKVFAAQKKMVAACTAAGKPVIVATQMLDSMMRQPRPTRAEVTDVGTAVYDGSDAVMLSGETAAGKYPRESVQAMASIVQEADALVDAGEVPRKVQPTLGTAPVDQPMGPVDGELDATARSAVSSATELEAKAILLITQTGRVARAVARHKPRVPVIAFCADARVARQLQLHRGIHPLLLPPASTPTTPDERPRMGILRTEAVRTAKEIGYIAPGDRVVFVDRNRGKVTDSFTMGTNLKVFTVV